ncbi:hypothetical protein HPP92_007713 [Vanilla planifolia]|uniref:F-box domain-containing protein n=1 Tax=Vanilla planifolia TaxID=51239 RepID=A0A835V826_VANPL|nr:hypothetical protein HPP92_007713 [Vanilla planifolia]
MKLRIRSAATKETIRVDVSDASSLLDLKALILSKIFSSITSSVSPESIHLSLNRKDEIIASSAGEPLHASGLTSGDLLFYSLDSTFSSASARSPPEHQPLETLINPLSSASAVLTDSNPESSEITACDMEMDSEPFILAKSLSAPCFLRRVTEAEKGKIKGNMGLAVVAIHAVFLEAGFVVSSCGGGGCGSSLPEVYNSPCHLVSVLYTLPDLIDRVNAENVQPVILKFSAVRNHVSVYGCLVGAHSDVYRLCLDSSKLSPLLASSTYELSGREEEEMYQFWRIVKDALCMPLLVDICLKNGLPLPPCFSLLPTDIKVKILELLSGVDLAKVACTSSEMMYLASNDDIWRRKVLDEFGMPHESNIGGTWKAKFARFWMRKKARTGRENALVPYIRTPRIIPVPWVPGPQRFPMVGGDYDRFPAIGDLSSSQRARFPFLHPARRNFSPHCNLSADV